MTTAEFIIGHSADDAAERRAEARKIFWALLAALVIHLIMGSSLAAIEQVAKNRRSRSGEEEKPMEMTLVNLPTPAPMKNPMFIENNQKEAEEPKDKTFQSNENSIGASEQPATGSMPLPSQKGSDRTRLDLDSQAASLAQQGAQAQPSVPPQQSATPQPTAQPTPKATPQELAMLTSRPTPRPTVASTPQQQRSSYQQYKEKTRLDGAITNRGIARLNAKGTPLGQYQKEMFDAIGSHWYAYMEQQMDLVDLGTVRVSFRVDRSGHIDNRNIKVLSNDANKALEAVCLRSIQDAKLRPIPDDVAAALPPEGLETEISFTTFSNR